MYEIEAEKAGLVKHLDLESEEIQFMKNKLKEDLFDEFLKEI